MCAYLTDIHAGQRLKSLVDKSVYTVDQVVHKMGYESRTSLYRLYEKDYIKPEVIAKACKVLHITESDFFQVDIAKDPRSNYRSKKYLEERVEDLERQINSLQNQIDKLTKYLKVTS